MVAPATYNGFLKIDQFVNSGDYGAGNDAVTSAKLGKAYNIEFYESQLTTGTSPSSDGCVWSKGHYFKIIQRAPEYHALYVPFGVAWQVSCDAIYGMFERQEADEAATLTTSARLWSCRLRSKK